MSTAVYTMDEVSKHNSLKDLWVVIEGAVYDLSQYADKHPGGVDVLLFVAGQDGTEDFNDACHSSEALEEMKQYKIGDLASSN